jgi:hypothetical protein
MNAQDAPEPEPAPPADAGASPEPAAQAPARRNPLAIAALISSLLGLGILAVALAVTALAQIVRRHEKGEREKGTALAFSAIAVSAAWLIALSLVMAYGPRLHRTGGTGRVAVARLNTGECFIGLEKTAADRLVTVLPCTRPHDGEIAAQASLSDDDTYPGDQGLSDEAEKVCTARFNFLAQSRYLDDLDEFIDEPTPSNWLRGDRHVTCAVLYRGGTPLSEPLAATVDIHRKPVGALVAGDCLAKWDAEASMVSPVSCSQPHEIEVYATADLFELRLGSNPFAYPGKKALARKAAHACGEHAEQVFGGHPPAGGVLDFMAPSAEKWGAGLPSVICVVKARNGMLTRTVVTK